MTGGPPTGFRMKILNKTRNTFLAESASRADGFIARIKGLLGRSGLKSGEGLLIPRCRCIHMFFMRFAIDAVFVGQDGCVVSIVENIPPQRISPYFTKADYVVELPAGTVSRTGSRFGDKILVIEDSD